MRRLTPAAARRVALGAQGLAAPRPPADASDRRHLRRVLSRTLLLQIDSVNVLERAHYLPAFTRLGPYDRALLERMAYGRGRELFEYWGHEASLLPLDAHPLLRWRMERAARGEEGWGRVARLSRERPDLLAAVRERVRAQGPVGAGELREGPRRTGAWWDWDEVKVALEALFWSGEVTTAARRGFERVYDLTERVLPAAVLDLPTPERADAQRELVRRAARAQGVATPRSLRDTFRLPVDEAAAAVRDLVEEGELEPVELAGDRGPWYLHRDAVVPRRCEAAALVSPFDPLVWERDRTRRLFGLDYRIEIYVPAEKRVHGYYVLPFLLGDRFAARVDLKADRRDGVLRVQAAWLEPGSDPHEVAGPLAAEMRRCAGWLGLADVAVAGRGDLAPALEAAL